MTESFMLLKHDSESIIKWNQGNPCWVWFNTNSEERWRFFAIRIVQELVGQPGGRLNVFYISYYQNYKLEYIRQIISSYYYKIPLQIMKTSYLKVKLFILYDPLKSFALDNRNYLRRASFGVVTEQEIQ